MALLFVDGFDAGDHAIKWVSSGSSNTTTRFGVGRSVRLNSTGGGMKLARSIPNTNKVIFGFAYYTDVLAQDIAGVMGDNAATTHTVISCLLDGTIVAKRGVGGTVLGTSAAGLIPVSSWVYIEVSTTIHDSTGTLEVKCNGQTALTFSGDTKNAGTSTNIDRIGFYFSNLTNWCYFDDFYLCDDTGGAPYNTFLGDIRIHTLIPDGAGSLTQMTPSSGANYTTVDELPYSATDYVRGSAGQTDLYTSSDLPAGVGTIFGVQANAVVKKSDAGTLSGRTVIKSGTTTTNGTSISLGTSDATITDIRSLNPDTSTAWTTGDVNGVEVGVGVV